MTTLGKLGEHWGFPVFGSFRGSRKALEHSCHLEYLKAKTRGANLRGTDWKSLTHWLPCVCKGCVSRDTKLSTVELTVEYPKAPSSCDGSEGLVDSAVGFSHAKP